MYAIVDIAGQQFRVEKDQKVFVHKLEGESGSKVDFDKVLLIGNNDNVSVGTPVLEGAMVYATIIDHQKGDKVQVFKKKRKKGYRKRTGHRQSFTQILIEDIIETGAVVREKEAAPKPVKAKKVVSETKTVTPAKVTPKPVKKASSKAAPKKAETKKPAVKTASKPAAKKATKKAGDKK